MERRRDRRLARQLNKSFANSTFTEGFLKFAPDGKTLAVGMMRGLMLIDLQTGEETFVDETQQPVWTVAFSADSKRIAFGDTSANTTIWDCEAKRLQLPPFKSHSGWMRALAFSPDGRTLVSGGADLQVKAWDVETGELLGEPFLLPNGNDLPSIVVSLQFSSDGQYLAAGTDKQNSAKLWRVEGRELLHEFLGLDAGVDSLAFSPDSTTLAAAGHSVRLWDVRTGRPVDYLRHEHGAEHNCLRFTPNGRTLAASTGSHCGVRLWRLNEPANPITIRHDGILCGAVSKNGDHFATGCDNGKITVWNTQTGESVRSLSHDRSLWALAFGRDEVTIASGGIFDGKVKLWNLNTGECTSTLPETFQVVTALEFSPDGQLLGCLDSFGKIVLWDLESQQVRHSFKAHERSKTGFSFSPNGKILATGGTTVKVGDSADAEKLKGQCVALWDVSSAKLLQTINGPQHQHINSIAFSSDGSRLAFGGSGGIVEVWDLTSHSKLRTITGHNGGVNTIRFTPDGRRLVSSDERTVKWWDLETGRLQFSLDAHNENIPFLGQTPDEGTLITGSRDGYVKLWRTVPPDRVEQLHRRWNELQSFRVDN